jgi:hypothetical protein
LRSGKPVFCYDIGTSKLSLDTDRPLDFAVFASYNRNDSARVRQICQFLNQARNFDVWLVSTDLGPIRNVQALFLKNKVSFITLDLLRRAHAATIKSVIL